MTCKEFACLVNSYLKGNLPAENQEEFELHYFECDDCFAQLKAAERLQSKEIPIVIEGRKPVFAWSSLLTWKPLLAAAAVLLVVLSSVFILHHSSHMNLIYRITTFSPPVYIKGEIRSPEITGTFAEAMQYYNKGDYSRALAILKKISDPDRNPQVTFFKGICFLLTDEPRNAIKEFDIIIENMNPSYYDEAIYYKAIALLRQNKKERALDQLNHLAGMFSPYATKAKALIKKVSNI